MCKHLARLETDRQHDTLANAADPDVKNAHDVLTLVLIHRNATVEANRKGMV